jgi:hypothetical protein
MEGKEVRHESEKTFCGDAKATYEIGVMEENDTQ